MGRLRRIRLDPKLEELLKNVPHEITHGSRHIQLRIGGTLVTVFPSDYRKVQRTQLNCVACVRRFLRSYRDVR